MNRSHPQAPSNAACWLIRQVHRRIPSLALLSLLSILSAYLHVVFVMITQQIIDSATTSNITLFHASCLQAIGCVLILAISTVLRTHLRAHSAGMLEMDWKRSLTHTLLHADYIQVSRKHSVEWINRLDNDVRTINNGLLSFFPGIASMITSFVAIITMLITMNVVFTLTMLFLGLLLVVFSALLRKHFNSIHKQISAANGKVSGFIQEALGKLLMIQAMDAADKLEQREQTLLEERWQLQRKKKNISIVSEGGLSLFSNGCSAIALIWCAVQLMHGQITLGTLIAVFQLMEQIKGPLLSVSSFIPLYFSMIASAERLMEIDQLGHSQPEPLDGKLLYAQMHELRATGLTYSYDGQEPTIRYSDFHIPKGSFTVLSGASGIGKSTLLKIMLGIFPPTSGMMCVDDLPLSRETRRLFAYVPQGNLLLSGSIRENICLTKPEASEAQLREALYVSDLTELIDSLPDGLDTQIGENALGLSEGQAQRVSIARAVLSDAPILLLDEATSALDADTEHRVLKRLSTLTERMIIAVTHRPAAVELSQVQIHIQ